MSRPIRQSILLRPRKSSSSANSENLEKEFEAERVRLQTLQRKQQEIDEMRGKALFGTPEQKEEMRSEVREVMERQLREKEERKRLEQELDQLHGEHIANHVASTSSVESAQEAQRREYLRTIMEENQRLVELRQQQKLREKEREVEYERQTGAVFFDRWGRNAR